MTRSLAAAFSALVLAGCWSMRMDPDAAPLAPRAIHDVDGLVDYLVASGVGVTYVFGDTASFDVPSYIPFTRTVRPDSVTQVARVDFLDFEGPGACYVFTFTPEPRTASARRIYPRRVFRNVDFGRANFPDVGRPAAFSFGTVEARCTNVFGRVENALWSLQAYAESEVRSPRADAE